MRITILLLVLFSQSIYAQETKVITHRKGEYKEVFSVLSKDNKIKHGSYKKLRKKDEVVIEGQYENNEKTGEWKFYSNGEIEQIYNYSTQELKQVTEPNYSLKYIGSDQLDSPPRFIGGKNGLNDQLNELMTYPTQALRMGIEGIVSAEFLINEDNSISDVFITRGIGAGCDAEFSNALKKINQGWITGKKGDKKMKCKVTLTVHYRLDATSSIILM